MTAQQIMARIRERDGDGDLLGLVKRIAAAHDVTVAELLESRVRGASDARFALWNILMERGHWSYARIGSVFGRTHGAVIDGIAVYRKREGLPPLAIGKGRRYVQPVEQALPTSEVA